MNSRPDDEVAQDVLRHLLSTTKMTNYTVARLVRHLTTIMDNEKANGEFVRLMQKWLAVSPCP